MTRALLVLTALTVLAVGCSSTSEPPPDRPGLGLTGGSSVAATVAAVGAGSAAVGRVPGTPLQRVFYFQAMGQTYIDHGMTEPSTTTVYRDVASSICNFLDAGASPADADHVLTDRGFTGLEALSLRPLAIAGYCVEHIAS